MIIYKLVQALELLFYLCDIIYLCDESIFMWYIYRYQDTEKMTTAKGEISPHNLTVKWVTPCLPARSRDHRGMSCSLGVCVGSKRKGGGKKKKRKQASFHHPSVCRMGL